MNYDGKTLKKILRMTQKQLKSYLESILQESGYRTINRKGFLYAPGAVPVLLVAHLDILCLGSYFKRNSGKAVF